MSSKSKYRWIILILLTLVLGLLSTAEAQSGYDPAIQTQALLYNEARTVYLGNLARRDNGVPPLRWNLQLTHAARWFSWDSTENRPSGFCGHQDTLGGLPGDRAYTFGYLGGAGAENAFCGYVTPEYAIQGWMNSSGHRANLLDPNSREIGLGYYRRDSDGRGYVTQDFGNDAVYSPVIIENEAISTTNPNVNLYIYDRSTSGGFAGFGAATQMMVSNNPNFLGVIWELFSANKPWTLTAVDGWQQVYVKTRDKFNRTLTVSDVIYLGANIPPSELGDAQMSTTQSQVTLYYLNGGTLPQVQFSLGWLADDTFGSFNKLWGNGERVNDAMAWGGTGYRLYPGDGESFAWVYDTSFIKNTPLVAYFRLKVNNNTSSGEVARIEVQGGPTVYGPLSLKGTDFTAPNQYQEFALNFTFNPTTNDPFLIFKFWRSGNADVYVDAVSIFSTPQTITAPLTWSVPGNNYRGQGVWVRYTNGNQFSDIAEGITIQEPSHNISGNTGVAGTTLNYTDGGSKKVFSLADGSYSLYISYNWSGKVTPSRPCFTFNPVNRTYIEVTSNQTAQDYTASPIPGSVCVLSITRASVNPTNANMVNFTVTFTQPVTGVNTSDFSLTTTGVTGASITNVSGSGVTYTVTVNTGSGNGTIRLDVVDDDSIKDGSNNPLGGNGLGNGNFSDGESYTVVKTPTFGDVSFSHPYWQDIEILYANGFTAGCSTNPLLFCPDVSMSRAQSAVFMLRGNFGSGYVPVTPTHFFKDNWKNSSWGEGWAESMYLEGLTGGCSSSPLKFCPDVVLSNVQLSVFGLRLKYGMTYSPPAATGTVFADMTDGNFWGTGWAEQAYADGLIPACGTSGGQPLFCPDGLVSRGFGASVIVKAKNLTMP